MKQTIDLPKLFSDVIKTMNQLEDLNNKLFEIIGDYDYLFQECASQETRNRYYETIQKKVKEATEMKRKLEV